MFGANRFSDRLPVGSWFIWDKRSPNGFKNVMSDAEVAWWNKGRGIYIYAHTWDGFNRASERQSALHPAQKPVALMRWCLFRMGASGLVVDPYCGSGPVLQAAKELGLHSVGIELHEPYAEIAVKRLGPRGFAPGGVVNTLSFRRMYEKIQAIKYAARGWFGDLPPAALHLIGRCSK